MSVTSVKELIKRNGSYDGTSQSHVRSWEIVVNSKYDNSVTIGNALIGTSLPNLFYTHPNNIFLTTRSLKIAQSKGLIWIATATYSSAPLSQSERERAEESNPLDRTVKIAWAAAEYEKAMVKDKDEKAIVNSAGDYYDPVPSVPWERLSFSFRQNFTGPQTWMIDYINSVNASDISILGISITAGNARFVQPSGSEEQEENGVIYHETAWNIEADVQTWQLELLDEGLREKSGTDRIAIVDGTSTAVTSPALLDGSGAVLADPTLDNAVFNCHLVYTEKDYTTISGIDAA